MGQNIKTDKMVRILLLTCDFPPNKGGISTHLYNLYTLLNREYDVDVLVLGMEGKDKENIYYKNVLKSSYIIEIIKMLSKKYDIIIVGTIYPIGWLLRGLEIESDIIYFIYGSELIYKKPYIPIPSHKLILRKANIIISISKFTSGLIDYDSYVYYPLINKFNVNNIKEKNRDYYVIGSLGRIEEHKNHISIISNIQKMRDIIKRKNNKDIIYKIAGSGACKQDLEKYIKNKNIENVEFLGELDEYGKYEFYNDIDLFLMPSIKTKKSVEGFGIVVQEAAQFRVPTIGYNSGGICESIIDNYCIIEEGNEEELINRICAILIDDKLRQKKGEEFYNRAKKFIIGEGRLSEFKEILRIGSGGRI